MRHPLISFCAAVTLLVTATFAHASTVIDFDTLSGVNASSFTTYTEGGYTVALSLGNFMVGTNFGNPVPDIYSSAGTVTLTKNDAGDFNFLGVDLANARSTPEQYTISGFLGSTLIFQDSGSVTGTGVFNAYDTGFSADQLSSLTIALSGDGQANIDNIGVNPGATSPAPEPGTLLLVASGLAAAAGSVRRRLAR